MREGVWLINREILTSDCVFSFVVLSLSLSLCCGDCALSVSGSFTEVALQRCWGDVAGFDWSVTEKTGCGGWTALPFL